MYVGREIDIVASYLVACGVLRTCICDVYTLDVCWSVFRDELLYRQSICESLESMFSSKSLVFDPAVAPSHFSSSSLSCISVLLVMQGCRDSSDRHVHLSIHEVQRYEHPDRWLYI